MTRWTYSYVLPPSIHIMAKTAVPIHATSLLFWYQIEKRASPLISCVISNPTICSTSALAALANLDSVQISEQLASPWASPRILRVLTNHVERAECDSSADVGEREGHQDIHHRLRQSWVQVTGPCASQIYLNSHICCCWNFFFSSLLRHNETVD